MSQTQQNPIIVVGHSYSGKTTLIDAMFQIFSEETKSNILLYFCRSATTRPPRDKKDKQKYFHVSEEEFNTLVRNNEFIEYTQQSTNKWYGTLKSEVNNAYAQNKIAILDVDCDGADKLIPYFKERDIEPKVVFVGLEGTPDEVVQKLKRRARLNPQEKRDGFESRMKRVPDEMSWRESRQHLLHFIVNENSTQNIGTVRESPIKYFKLLIRQHSNIVASKY